MWRCVFWLGLATAILVGTVVVIQRQRGDELESETVLTDDSSVPEDCSCPAVPTLMAEISQPSGVEILASARSYYWATPQWHVRLLAEELLGSGITALPQTVIGDNRKRLIAQIQEIAGRSGADHHRRVGPHPMTSPLKRRCSVLNAP